MEKRLHLQVIIILRENIHGKMVNMEKLHAAGYEGSSTKKVKEILQNKVVNVNSKDEQGKTALHYACQKGQFEIVKILINRGADINIQTISKKTPLHLATKKGKFEIVKFLLSKGALVNAKTKFGTQPLHMAAENGYCEIAETLIDHGADVDCKIIELNFTPLLLAVKNKSNDIANLLLQKGANPDHQIVGPVGKGHVTPLTQAIENQDLEMVNILIEKSGTSLFTAIRESNLGNIKYLVENGTNFKVKIGPEIERTAMDLVFLYYWEKRLDYKNIVKIFVENGYDLANADDKTLIRAIKLNMSDLTEYLIEKGANPNANDQYSPLIYAIIYCNFRIAKKLIEKGADVHRKFPYGQFGCGSNNTPIHMACFYSQLTIVKILVKRGVNINAKNDQGRTPLHVISSIEAKTATKIAKILIDNGSKVDGIDASNKSPLYYAVEENNLEIVKLLVEKGAKVEGGLDCYGRNPLYRSIENGNLEMAKFLIENGANLNLQATNSGNTPLHLAINRRSMEMIQLLLDNGADLNLKNMKNQTPLDLQKSICCNQEILDKIIQRLIKDKENSEIAEEPRGKRFKFEDCVICYEPRYDMFVLNPCGHAKTCEACCIKILHLRETNTSCPVCREKVTSYVKADF